MSINSVFVSGLNYSQLSQDVEADFNKKIESLKDAILKDLGIFEISDKSIRDKLIEENLIQLYISLLSTQTIDLVNSLLRDPSFPTLKEENKAVCFLKAIKEALESNRGCSFTRIATLAFKVCWITFSYFCIKKTSEKSLPCSENIKSKNKVVRENPKISKLNDLNAAIRNTGTSNTTSKGLTIVQPILPQLTHSSSSMLTPRVNSESSSLQNFALKSGASNHSNEGNLSKGISTSSSSSSSRLSLIDVQTPRPIGLPNRGNDCFFNAVAQVLLSSPLFRDHIYRLSETNLAGMGDRAQSRIRFWKEFLHKQDNALKSGASFFDYRKDEMRNAYFIYQDALDRITNIGRQEDAAQVLNLTLADLDISDLNFDIEVNKIPVNSAIDTSSTHLSSPLNEIDHTSSIERHSVFEVGSHLINGQNTLEDVIHKSFYKEERVSTPMRYSLGHQNYISSSYIENRMIKPFSNKELFVVLNRTSDWNQSTRAFSINTNEVPLVSNRNITVFDREFHLASFVLHEGGNGSGHYESYVKSGNIWYCCSDRLITQVDEKKAFQMAAYASIIRLTSV
jgi:ubiquitin C-terminal hydrolase